MNMGDPFSSLRPGEPFNGITGVILQEDEDFEKAKLLLNEWTKSYGLFDNENELEALLDKFNLNFDNLSTAHKRYLVIEFVR